MEDGRYTFIAELGSNIHMKLTFEGMIGGSWRTAKARQCAVKSESMSGGPERTFCKPVKVRPRLQWRPWGDGEARTMESVPKRVLWAWIGANLAEDVPAESNRAAGVELSKLLEHNCDQAICIPSRYSILTPSSTFRPTPALNLFSLCTSLPFPQLLFPI